jgi:hypothetical protein
MTQHRKRAKKRFTFEAPIVYSVYNSKEFQKAHLKNYSSDGMRIEDSIHLEPDTYISIKIIKPLPKNGAVEDFRHYRAKIKWCRCEDVLDKTVCGKGVQHVAKCSYEKAPIYYCALSGEEIPEGELRLIDDFVYLRRECYQQYTELPNGFIKKALKNYMDGNVV